MADPLRNPDAWVPCIPSITNTASQRSAVNYVAVAKQFDVENNPRYARGHAKPGVGRETYCNIFLWDVTLAMGCEIPHWIDPATFVSVPMGKGREQDANTVCDWMAQHSLSNGWMVCGEKQARLRASGGFPTVVAWKNPGGIGHVAVILPGSDFTHIAQSGGTNFFDGDIHKGFGALGPLVFYTHD